MTLFCVDHYETAVTGVIKKMDIDRVHMQSVHDLQLQFTHRRDVFSVVWLYRLLS